MGRRRALAALLIAAASLGASAPGELPLREARWIAPDAQFEQLSTFPMPCFGDWPDDLFYGAAAFRDPLLLGGQTARAGLSCASCHRGGRGNPAFVFPGISGAPGTADITASLFSSHRGDSVFNPVRIPDLTHDKPKISRTEPGVLEAFIRGLIVEEFDGAEPPPRVLKGLAEAVRALDAKTCDKDLSAFDADVISYGIAFSGAQIAVDEGDRETAAAMLRAARSALGTIAERYPPSVRSTLDRPDAALASVQQMLHDGRDLGGVKAALNAQDKATDSWAEPLFRSRARSLYNPKRLAKALNAARTP